MSNDDNDFTVTWEDRKLQVLDLFEQGRKRRDIAKICRMNFTDIKKIVDSKYGPPQDKNKSKCEMSGYQLALKLFLGNAKPVYVAIKLQLDYEEVRKIYLQFLSLNRMYKLKQMYDEVGNDMKAFLSLYQKMRENRFTVEELMQAASYVGYFSELEERHAKLSNDNQKLQSEIQNSGLLAQELENQNQEAKARLEYYNYLCEMKKKEVTELNFTMNRNNAAQNVDYAGLSNTMDEKKAP